MNFYYNTYEINEEERQRQLKQAELVKVAKATKSSAHFANPLFQGNVIFVAWVVAACISLFAFYA